MFAAAYLLTCARNSDVMFNGNFIAFNIYSNVALSVAINILSVRLVLGISFSV